MNTLNFLLLVIILLPIFEHPHRILAHARRKKIQGQNVEPARGYAAQEGSAAKTLADEISSKGSSKKNALKDLQHHILSASGHKDEIVQQVQESLMFNALHEAIDEKIVNQSFIRTLASVSEPPLVNDQTRDTLLVNSIKEIVNFTFGENVFAWKTLEHKNHDHHVIVGFSNEKIVILYEHFGEYTLEQEIPLETEPTAFEVITVWDSMDDAAVSCLVVATQNALVWYTMRAKSNFALTEEWRWPLHKTTTLIRHLSQKDTHMLLLVGTHPNARRSVSATLYEFNFERQQFWLMHVLDLEFPCKSVGLVTDGNEFLIAIPQNDTARIYTLEVSNKYRGKFNLTANITSEEIHSVGAFQIGRYSYIAIGGRSPQILRYSSGNFTSQKIPTEALAMVEAFFVVPTRTYRDDLILLVQHKTTFSTHELQRLDVLVWNGESFDLRSNIPCYVEDDITGNEVSCMLDLHRPTGIVGSTIVQRGNQVSMIIPRYQAHSSLFHLNVGMLSGQHPITQKIQEIRDTIDAFTKIIDYQDSVIFQALELIAEEAKQLNKELVVLENCTLESVHSNVAIMHSNFPWPKNGITIGNQSWNPTDATIDVPAISHAIEHESNQLLHLEHQLQFTVRRHNDSFSLELEHPLHVQGRLEVGGALVTDDLYVRRLEEEPFTIRVPRQTAAPNETLEELHVRDLKVRYLNFAEVNGVPAGDLVFNDGQRIELQGKLVVEEELVAENVVLPKGGTVNGVDLSESTVYFNCKNRHWKELWLENVQVLQDVIVSGSINGIKLDMDRFRAGVRDAEGEQPDVLVADKLVLNGSIYFENINGIPWNDIIQRIVLKNRPNRLLDLRIKGSLILEHPNITVYHLNGLAFPSDYLLSTSPRESVVTGYKRFMNTTYINILDIENTINGVDLKEVVTLQDHQHIPGTVTFAELHISEQLDVRGSVRGKFLDKFLDNPTLQQAQLVRAACQFKYLHVDGPVIVRDALNGANLDETLADVVYVTEHNVEISATKRIQSAEFLGKVTVESNMINEHRLDDFVTRSTNQKFDVAEISGNIFFHDLTVDGLFDGINVTELDMNSVKLYGDQYTEASLVFKNPKNSPFPDIEANEFRIEKMLNSKPRSQYVDVEQEEIVLTGEIAFNQLDVKNLVLVKSAVDGPSKMIGDVHLPTLDNLRFSLTRPQTITAPYFIEKLVVSRNLDVAFINGRDFRNLKAGLEQVDNFKNHLLMGRIPIENLYIAGDLQVNMLNDVNFDALLEEVIWLNRPNRIPGTIHFLDPLIVQQNLTVRGSLNEMKFGEFLNDVVLKSDEVAEFYGTRVFANGLVVEGDLDTESINNIFVKDLALKNQTIYLRGDVRILGQLTVDHLQVEDRVNGDPVRNILDQYKYDSSREVHVIKGDLYVHSTPIQTLNIQGSLNQIPNVDMFLASMIRKDQDYNFTKALRFKNEVVFENGLTIANLNGQDISNIQNEIVRINEIEPVELNANVVFNEPVRIRELTIQGDLIAPDIDGINPDQLLNHAVMINQDVDFFGKTIFEPGTFVTEHIQVDILNGQPMDKLFTLNTPQAFEGPVVFDEIVITKPLQVGGLINGVNFPFERQNTLMTYGDQSVTVPTVFNSIRVLNALTLPPMLNGMPFGKPVLLGTKMMIQSPVSFRHLVVESLQTEDMISGIDFNAWYENSLWTAGRDHQVIDAKVSAQDIHFKAGVIGNGKINGVDINDMIKRMKAAKRNVDSQLQDYRAELRTLCSSTKKLIGETQTLVYFFKYFVQRQVINEQRPIESFHFFDHLGYHFLAINMDCESFFHQWDPVGRVFVPMFKFYTGVVEEWETVIDGDRGIYLVTRSSTELTKCKIGGVGVWLFTSVQLRLIWSSVQPEQVLELSSDRAKQDSFYALKGGRVYEYGVDGNVLEQWELPKSALGYRFVPHGVGLGLALSDGKLLVLLSSVNRTTVARGKRETNKTKEFIEMALFSSQSMYSRMKNSSAMVGSPLSTVIEPNAQHLKTNDHHINGTLVHINEVPAGGAPSQSLDAIDPMHAEATIARDIPLGGIFTADNQYFPERSRGEIIAFHAGKHDKKRHLVAVASAEDSIVNGDNDAIRIYVDIQTGMLYQVLPCHRPSHLTALELRDQTILVFLEARRTIQVYIYRGSQGFVRLSSFHLASRAVQMTGVALPQPSLLKCRLFYLAIATERHELVFLRAKTQGDCGLTVNVDCDIE